MRQWDDPPRRPGHRRPRRAGAGRRPGVGRGAPGRIDHVFHLAAIYDMTADDATNDAMNVDGTRHALALAEALDAGLLPPGLLASPLPATSAASSTRRCSTRASTCPRRTTARSTSPSGSSARSRPCRGGSTVPRSSSVTPRPGRWTRSTAPTTSSRSSSCCATPCPPGCRWSASTSATPTWCRSTTSPRRWTTSRTCPAATARPSTWSTPSPQPVVEVINLVLRRRRRPALRHPDRPPRHVGRTTRAGPPRRCAPRPSSRPSSARRRAGWCSTRPWVGSGIPAEVLGHTSFTATFDSRRTEKALSGSGISVPDLESYAGTLWGYWEDHLDQATGRDRATRRGAPGQARGHHRRLVRHRPGHRAQGGPGRRHPGPRRARQGQARGDPGDDRDARRHGARLRLRPLRPRVDRPALRAG